MILQCNKIAKTSRFSGIILLITLFNLFSANGWTQCTTGCTTTLNNYTSSSYYTFASGLTCVTGTTTINNDVTFASGSSICVGTGATLNLGGNNFTFSSPTTMVTIDVYGTLNVTQNPTWEGNMTINIHSKATMTTNTLTLNGNTMNITNDGTFNPGTLQFQNSGATITITNSNSMTVGQTLNITAGNAWFKNTGTLIVTGNYNSDATSVYVNCGKFSGKFNLKGGRVINSGSGVFNTGQIDYGSGTSVIENYGKMNVTGNVNLGGTTSTFYNEGIVDLSTTGQFQSDGNLKGPSTGVLNTLTGQQKVGYFIWATQATINTGSIGPNLNLKNPSGISSKDVMFGINKPNVVIDATDTWGNAAPATLPNTDCPDADGTPSTPVPTATRACAAGAGANLTSLQPSVGGVTYEWWTNGTTKADKTPNGTKITANLSNYTTVGTVYLWAKNYSGEYSDAGAAVIIDAASVGGTASANQVIPTGTSPATLSLTGYTGTIQWQSSSDNSSFNNISGATSATLTAAQMGTLAATTYYRAMVTNNSCAAATSNVITITVIQPFTCSDAKVYLTQKNSTGLYEVVTSTNPFTYPLIGSQQSFTYNGTAFNPLDGYLYAIKLNTNILYRIGQGGIAQEIGAVTNLLTGNYNAGECDDQGNYYVKDFNKTTTLDKINLTTMSATTLTLNSGCSLPDMAYSVKDRLLYGVTSTTCNLISIDLTTSPATVKTIGSTGLGAAGSSVGAMYASSTGSIYGNWNSGGFYEFNTATGASTLISGSDPASINDGAHCVTAPITFGADLAITKTDGTTQYTPGTTVTYTIVASNKGPFGVMGALVKDNVPTGIPAANVTYTAVVTNGATTSVSGTQTGAINDVVSLPYKVIDNGDGTYTKTGSSVTYTVNVVVPSSYTGNLTNTATIAVPTSGSTTDPIPSNNTATDVDTQNSSTGLSATKSVDISSPKVGDTVTFTITAHNTGPSDATGVKVTDVLSPGYSFVLATPSAGTSYDSAKGSWVIGNLANGSSATLTIKAKVL